MAFVPDDADKVTLTAGDYACPSSITFKPTARKLRFAFWDFVNRTNADVLATMPKAAEQARATLATADFTPAGIRGFDSAKSLADLESLLKKPRVRELLGAKAAEVDKWIADSRPLLENPGEQQSIRGQEKMAAVMDAYQGFIWDAKLAELFDF